MNEIVIYAFTFWPGNSVYINDRELTRKPYRIRYRQHGKILSEPLDWDWYAPVVMELVQPAHKEK